MAIEEVWRNIESFFGVERGAVVRRQRGTIRRGLAARWLCQYSGLTQRAAAKALGVTSGAAVSAQLRALDGRLAADPALSERVHVAERRLLGKTRKDALSA